MSTSNPAIDLPALLADPSQARHIRPEHIPALLCQLSALQVLCAAHLTEAQAVPTDAGSDNLLTVADAATRLGLSQDWLYRHSSRLPFTVRVGRHLRFSAHGIERYIRQRQGR